MCPVVSSSLFYSFVEYVDIELLDMYSISNCFNVKTLSWNTLTDVDGADVYLECLIFRFLTVKP